MRSDLEVINAGQVGWTSGETVGVAQRVMAGFNPSALIVYSGNNEWIHWSSHVRPGLDPRHQRTLATSRLLAGALYIGARRRERSPSSKVGSPLFGYAHALDNPDPYVDMDDWRARKARFLEVFRQNLENIRQLAQSKNVEVVFVTVPFQHRLSPSFHHPQPAVVNGAQGDEIQQLLGRAAHLMSHDDCPNTAVTLLERAVQLDRESSVAHSMLATCYERKGRFVEAEATYARARELTVGNLGSRLSINEVIRQVASSGGLNAERSLLDAARLFDEYEHDRGRHFNETLIHDDCHPTPEGHLLIAGALAERLEGP
jgi:tetratricopeptide (TPR) repeat protein